MEKASARKILRSGGRRAEVECGVRAGEGGGERGDRGDANVGG